MSSIAPSWSLVDVRRTRLGEHRYHRDYDLRVSKEVLSTPRHVVRVYYTLDGRRRVYRGEDELINAIMRRRRNVRPR